MSDNNQQFSNFRTIRFVFILCFSCALLLSVVSYSLKDAQNSAKELYRSKQLLIAAKILSYQGLFQIRNDKGQYINARYDHSQGKLTADPEAPSASSAEILQVYSKRIQPMLVNQEGEAYTFKEAGIDFEEYLENHQKKGYAHLKNKLIYFLYSGSKNNDQLIGFVIPVNGYGLWDAIYGYLGVEADGKTVLATTWYDEQETPGLGGNISLPSWQKQFQGKWIFRPNEGGNIKPKKSPIGIKVVKTTVEEEIGEDPKAKNAVDGIAGATTTVNGVTAAYRDSLAPYRNFLAKQYQKES